MRAIGEWRALRADACRYGAASGAGAVWAAIRHPGLFAIAVHRYGLWVDRCFGRRWQRIPFRLVFHIARRISLFRAQIDLLDGMPIGPGLYLADGGAIVIGARRIGANCSFGSRVTLGMETRGQSKPVVGDDVVLEDRAIVYGDVTLNDGVRVCAGAVLTKSAPAHVEVQGNPGRIVRRPAPAGGELSHAG